MRQSAVRGALDDLNGQAVLPDEPSAAAAAILAMTSDAVPLLDVRAYPDGNALAVFLADVTGERPRTAGPSLAVCIVSALPVATAVVGASGRILEVNDEWLALAAGAAAAMSAAIRAALSDPSAGVRLAYG